jgi:hypothetical protein
MTLLHLSFTAVYLRLNDLICKKANLPIAIRLIRWCRSPYRFLLEETKMEKIGLNVSSSLSSVQLETSSSELTELERSSSAKKHARV